MKRLLALILGITVLQATFTWAENTVQKEPLHVTKTKRDVAINSHIKGDQHVDYRIEAKSGQALTVEFTPNHHAAYFNVLPPASEAALFTGSIAGNHFTGVLTQDGVYTIRVYLMRSAARRGERATFNLRVNLTGEETIASPTGNEAIPKNALSKTLEMQGLRFEITCANEGSQNEVHIVPSGLERDNSPIFRTIDGTVTGAEVADLNADGAPEIYIYTTSAGSGSSGDLIAYAANRKKSLSEIYLPPLSEDAKAAKGYMGHDEFAVLEGVLGRRFPIYKPGDTNAAPTGGTRQLQYRLVPGEASWRLQIEKTVEY